MCSQYDIFGYILLRFSNSPVLDTKIKGARLLLQVVRQTIKPEEIALQKNSIAMMDQGRLAWSTTISCILKDVLE